MFYIIVILAAVFAMPGKAQSLRDQLIGAWSLVSCNIQGFPWCVGPHDGIAIFDASGRYAIVNTARGRPKFRDAQSPRDNYSAEEYNKWTVVSGVGKYAGMTGNGATEVLMAAADGRLTLALSGTLNMK
jgi:hypothetical protein